jgi:hypothetical protein
MTNDECDMENGVRLLRLIRRRIAIVTRKRLSNPRAAFRVPTLTGLWTGVILAEVAALNASSQKWYITGSGAQV